MCTEACRYWRICSLRCCTLFPSFFLCFLIGGNIFFSILCTFSGYLLARMEFLSVISTLSIFPLFLIVCRSSFLLPWILLFLFLAGYPYFLAFPILFLLLKRGKKTIKPILIFILLSL